MSDISFKPKQATRRLLSALPARARAIIENRYGLDKKTQRQTLEAIGETYGVTRERVRQIENAALAIIRKSEAFKEERETFDELEHLIESLGGVVLEEDLLKTLTKDESTRNHIHFLLVLGDSFVREKEDIAFRSRWHVDKALADRVYDALHSLYQNISDDDLISESEMIRMFLDGLTEVNQKYRNEEIARRWLSLSKKLAKNPLGEWGLAHSSNVRTKGIRDYAYLAIKRNGSPMHFTEVAKAITDLFDKKAHVATCHNELIKDARFVLVGRGLYALSEWGYTQGVVKDVIVDILKKEGPLSRDEIIERVKKERYVKDNTILVNLQDSVCFKKNKNGAYVLA